MDEEGEQNLVDNSEKQRKPPRKNKIPVRRRFKHVKRHIQKPVATVTSPASVTEQNEPVHPADPDDPLQEISLDTISEVDFSPGSSLQDHDYASPTFSRPCSSLSAVSVTDDASLSDTASGMFSPGSSGTPSVTSWPPTPHKECTIEQHPTLSSEEIRRLLLDVRDRLILMLPYFFVPVVDNDGIHVLMVGRRESKAVQREIFVTSNGAVRIQVHGADFPAASILSTVRSQKPLSEENCGYFVDRIVEIVSKLRLMEICAGMDKMEFKEAWSVTTNGVVEADVFKEARYTETFRSKQCCMLVDGSVWRCKECTKLTPFLRRKLELLQCENPPQNANIRYLVDKQKENRLSSMQKKVRNQQKTIDRLQAKFQEMIAKEGVKVEENLSNDLTEILQTANLSREHSLFLQQQLKAIKCKKSCGMRWHPTLIRLALSIYLKAPGAYKALSESGFIKLPSARTLFDYSHATKIEQGIDSTALSSIVEEASAEKHSHKQYHVLMADEIHISKNLAVQKSTGEVIGFTNLDNVDREVKVLESFFDDPDKIVDQEIASKVMSFMVKGVSNRVKTVVASYPVLNPSPKQMYVWTWDVIGALEKSGVMVIAFTCDGCPMNRAFIKLHQPATFVPSGVVFDTINKYAPHRKLFFFSDVPHLLKTIRNALFNSRLGKKGTRSLKKNGQPMVWDTIIKLYLSKKDNNLRKTHKLNAQNVFPDSYSKMKVKPAAAIISRSVANDIQSQQWPQTTELVDFLVKTNDWFDLLNGAFSSHGTKTNNRRLNPYTNEDIEDFLNTKPSSRFQELLDYLQYLEDWKKEVESRKDISLFNELGVQPIDEVSFHALDESTQEEFEDDSKCLLPHQTLLGIEMSSRAFIGAVTFLIEEGVTLVNARVFCQDPLEQNFGKQRMGGGGSSNPNVSQYLFKQRAITTVGQLAAAKRSSGNTEVLNEENDLSSAPLPKRRNVK